MQHSRAITSKRRVQIQTDRNLQGSPCLVSSFIYYEWQVVFAVKYIKVTFSAKAELSRNMKSPLELNMFSDKLKLILNHLHVQDPFCRFFLQQNFNPRIIFPTAWHISISLFLSAVSLLPACGMQVNLNIKPQENKWKQVIFKFPVLWTKT